MQSQREVVVLSSFQKVRAGRPKRTRRIFWSSGIMMTFRLLCGVALDKIKK